MPTSGKYDKYDFYAILIKIEKITKCEYPKDSFSRNSLKKRTVTNQSSKAQGMFTAMCRSALLHKNIVKNMYSKGLYTQC